MAWGPNLAPGRCEVPPSNGAPMIMTSVPAQDAGSSRSARGTPRNVASGPYILPSRAIGPPPKQASAPATQTTIARTSAGRSALSLGGRSAGSGPGSVAVAGRGLDPAVTDRRAAGQDPGQR